MPPMTHSMACKGIRHYVPYNLHSCGPNQTLLDLSTLLSPPRTLTYLHNDVGACGVVPTLHIHVAKGNPPANTNEFIYPDIRRAIEDGIPPVLCIHHVTVGFAVKTRFIQDCLELVKAVGEEQKKILLALEANEIISQERLEMFGEYATNYVDRCMEIAMEALANEIEKYGIFNN
ncbi:hypothetical protein EDD16DRAFT_1528249 [Pisolithus croceorrhizus]|nr:hypothetical protein EDD16DRAFT_1528249 [Pisolithus croceorrhizus]KAI6167578.1 hypothetical protein EDD17DRAFT_1503857 [Pisolithus thermaeus]